MCQVGFEMDVTTSMTLAVSLNKAVREEDAYFNKLMRIMATRCMTQVRFPPRLAVVVDFSFI